MTAFIHWAAITFSRKNLENDELLVQSFFKATELFCEFEKAPCQTLISYHAHSGKKLTANGSLLLHFNRHAESMIIITGTDCERIKNWHKVYEFFNELSFARISRLDIAIDIERQCTLKDVDDGYSSGQFSIKGKVPSIQHIGQFVKDDGNPRTIYIGKRQSGKVFRAYEIGRKHKLNNLQTIRLEVELRGSKRVIPLDALSNPLQYFCGAYPYLKKFSNGDIITTDARSKVHCATYQKQIEHLKNSYGQLVSCMLEIERSAETVIKLISRPGYPKGLTRDQIESLKKQSPGLPPLLSGVESGVKSGVKSKPHSEIAINILHHLRWVILSKLDLAKKLGHKKPNRYFHELVGNLRLLGLIQYTIPEKPNSRLQQYRITEEGIAILSCRRDTERIDA